MPQPDPPKYVAPPAEMEEKYKAYYYGPTTTSESAWAYYNLIGSTTHAEDSAARSTTVGEWEEAKKDENNVQKFDKMYGEVASDVDQTAMRVSEHLEQHPDVNLNDLTDNRDLLINR